MGDFDNSLFVCWLRHSCANDGADLAPHVLHALKTQVGHAIRSLDVPFLYRDFGIVIINAIDTEVNEGLLILLSYETLWLLLSRTRQKVSSTRSSLDFPVAHQLKLKRCFLLRFRGMSWC